MFLQIAATAMLLTDSILSGLLKALGILNWTAMNRIEINPILRFLGSRDCWQGGWNPRWCWWARVLWALYWAAAIALVWVLPDSMTKEIYIPAVILLSAYGIISIVSD